MKYFKIKNRSVDLRSELGRLKLQLEQINGILSRLKTDDKGRVLILKSDKDFLNGL